ncbi:methionyl-tRNA formyltransferase [Sphingomicrobium clamense]|uniref:Methionyl-tRNA formyltransferase n=1 Tax=Sphingomicrobium clamense TaxID=2851013 RepID=A0ABS6V5X2_9SPHN|nr:methionyl-tRNA formyltransferase [Sphingomicrobium sp. B8]MBW0144955.1 methionyl-tRNA formyltransferase [Sphingomicrobium sp. B8]
MKIIMMGSPDFAVPTLNVLVEAGHDVVAVYSQPPRRAGRGKQLQPTPVAARAEELGIPAHTPTSLKSAEEQAKFAAFDADVAIVAAYGLILPQAILDAPRLGCVNVHASLLPRWRGAAPVQRAIMAGDEITGITLMQMEAGLDTGPMLMKIALPIENKNAAQMTEELAVLGATMVATWAKAPDACTPQEQPEEGVTYAKKIDKAEARIDWSRPAKDVARHVQGLAPFPGSWTEAKGERLKILACEVSDGDGDAGTVLDDRLTVACGDGAIRVTRAQRAGKPAADADDLLRGFALPEGTRLG